MQTNNPFAEVGAIILAGVLILVAGFLLYTSKIDTAFATSIFILAGAIFAGNLALKAPSPTQQAALMQLTAQALQAQQAPPAQLVQAPAPLAEGGIITQPATLTTSYNPPPSVMPQVVQMPFNPASSVAATTPFAPAIMTTQNMPAAPKQ